MLNHLILTLTLLTNALLISAHLPYLDPINTHSSYENPFVFPDNNYSRVLLSTTTCPPPYYQKNKTAYYYDYDAYYSKQTWSKVHLTAGEPWHFEFGIPYLPSLEYPPFRPSVYLIGECLPSCDSFGYPKPQQLNYIPFQMSYGYQNLKALRWFLPDPAFQPSIYYDRHLEAQLAIFMNYTVPVYCEGDYYIVVETSDKRVVEYFTAVGDKEGFPPGGDPTGIASLEEAQGWAQGENYDVGRYCKRQGYWERE